MDICSSNGFGSPNKYFCDFRSSGRGAIGPMCGGGGVAEAAQIRL